MKLLSSEKYVEKKSKFIASLYEISDEKDFEETRELFIKNHKKATHHCYAAIIKDFEKIKNDGEVGYPAKTLIGLLKNNNYDSHLLIVARYFGGTKLGPAGVKRAFKEAGKRCLN